MDEQNLQNEPVVEPAQTEQPVQTTEQSVQTEQPAQNFYQDNTANYNQVPPVAPVPEKKTDALAIISLIAGIISILMCCTCYYAAIPGIIGIVCAIFSKKNNGKSGLSTAGLICSIVGIVLGFVVLIVTALILASGAASLDYLNSYNY